MAVAPGQGDLRETNCGEANVHLSDAESESSTFQAIEAKCSHLETGNLEVDVSNFSITLDDGGTASEGDDDLAEDSETDSENERQESSLPKNKSIAGTKSVLEERQNLVDNRSESVSAITTADDGGKQTGKAKKRLGRERTADEKARALHAKYLQQVADTRALEREVQVLRRKCEQANKEKDTMTSELRRESGVKQKLESLCRELQKQNKTILDDSKRIALEESQKRHDLSTKFHNTIKEITSKMDEQGEDRLRQVKENEALREKLKHFSQHYELREQHFLHQLRTKVLEQQLLDAKLKQQQELTSQEEAKARLYYDQVSQLLQTEGELRQQLSMYGEKFEQFQDTLTKSNEVFASFKKEMEKMSKTIKKLEKENAELKKNSTETKFKLIEMLDEKTSVQKQLDTTKLQKEKLEALCRSLQNERKSALAAMNNNSQRPEATETKS